MKNLVAFCHAIDFMSIWAAKLAQWLCLPLVIVVTIEVVARYVFNSPTIWSWDISIQIMAAIATLSAGYGLLLGSHVRVDIVINQFSKKVNLIVDLFMAFLFFFGLILLLRWFGDDTMQAIASRQLWDSNFRPPIYPLKVAMLIGVALLLLQGVAKFLRDLLALARPLEKHGL